MPEERRHVRVVGPKFLPDAGAEIDFSAVTGQQAAAVDYAEWLVMTTITRIFEAGGAEKDLHLASK